MKITESIERLNEMSDRLSKYLDYTTHLLSKDNYTLESMEHCFDISQELFANRIRKQVLEEVRAKLHSSWDANNPIPSKSYCEIIEFVEAKLKEVE